VLFWLAPAVARAGIIEWIDQWSGPGPFVGYVFDWRVACQYVEKDNDDAPRLAGPRDKWERALGAVGVTGPCVFSPSSRGKRIAALTVSYGFFGSRRNDLWAGEPGVDDDVTKVKLISLEVAYWVRFARSTEVGFGAGNYWISGPAFEPFTRTYLKPIQIDFKPGVFIKLPCKGCREGVWGSLDELVSLRGSLILIPSGFNAADFGAPSSYRVVRDKNLSLGLFVDLEPLARRIRGR
jgi:hypothetical protein